jgi:uncharacterized iron-regulated membrane protein
MSSSDPTTSSTLSSTTIDETEEHSSTSPPPMVNYSLQNRTIQTNTLFSFKIDSSSSFTLWATVVIGIVGCIVITGLIGGVVIFLRRDAAQNDNETINGTGKKNCAFSICQLLTIALVAMTQPDSPRDASSEYATVTLTSDTEVKKKTIHMYICLVLRL